MKQQLIDLSSDHFNQNAHAVFKQLRHKQPIALVKLNRFQKTYLITRYDDVAAALKDPRIIKDPRSAKKQSGISSTWWLPPAFKPLLNNMLNSDEPDHRRLRNLVHKAFTPRMIMQLQPRIEAIANELLDQAVAAGQVDLIEAYAKPLPINVISEMIGVPRANRINFADLTQRILVNPSPVNMLKAVPAVRGMVKYLRRLAADRGRAPQDDLASALVLAQEDGDKLSEDEVIGTLFLLLVAGHETTISLIANGTRSLLQHPDQLALLRADNGLLDTAIEEMLRYDGALQTAELSFAGEEITLNGVTIPHGHAISAGLMSANRDETAFENADVFDITRTPNKHLAFGHGIHYCLGAPLARLEGKIAFQMLLERAPNLRLTVADDQLRYTPLMMVNKLEALPVAF